MTPCEILTWNVRVEEYTTPLYKVCIHNEAYNFVIPCEVTDEENLENTINRTLLYCIQLHKKKTRFIAVELCVDEKQRLVTMLDGAETP